MQKKKKDGMDKTYKLKNGVRECNAISACKSHGTTKEEELHI